MSFLQTKCSYLFLSFLTLLVFLQPAKSQGYTFSNCLTNEDCIGPRKCLDASKELSEPCQNNGNYCLCIPPTINDLTCTESSNCDEGETCTDLIKRLFNEATISDGLCFDNSQLPFLEKPTKCETDQDCDPTAACINLSTFPYCGARIDALVADPTAEESTMPELATMEPLQDISQVDGGSDQSILPQSSTEGGDACIAVQSLMYFPVNSLKYPKHRIATVLCDDDRNCATPGHMVIFQGNTMMMRSYCRIVGCATETMLVNSPRYERKLRVPSNTIGLSFLAFASRYGTITEERIFQVAVRMGL